MNFPGTDDIKENLLISDSQEFPSLIESNYQKNNVLNTSSIVYNRNSSALQLKPIYSIFLFVNPRSGGNKAADFTNLQTEKIKFFSIDPKNEYETEAYIYNLCDNINRMRGFMTLKQELHRPESSARKFRVIVCGGDGSVMWVIDEMLRYDINQERCPIGILPFGTGNDFSRVLGWGGEAPSDIIGRNLESFKELIISWAQAEVQEFDIWQINIETNDNGCFKSIQKVNGESVKEVVYEKDTKKPIKSFSKKMSNYFSIGIDARIGLGFERHRTSNRFCNLLVYCCEGLKKLFIKTSRVNSVLDSLEEMHKDEISNEHFSHMDINIEDLINKRQILFTTKSAFREVDIKQSDTSENTKIIKKMPKIQGNPASLLCLNINSYMGGASDVWKECLGNIGIEKESAIKFESQDFSDGKLEFVTFSSSVSLAEERIFKGQAKRVGQGSGPFLLNFKKTDIDSLPLKTYFQIDGEYFEIISPNVCRISSCKELPNGKIKVLVKKTK